VLPLRGEKPKNRLVSKNNTGRAALRADPAGKITQLHKTEDSKSKKTRQSTEESSVPKATTHHTHAHLGPGKTSRSVVELDPASAPVSLNVDHIPAT